ncbi:peptidoglycan-binding protein [Actinomyces urinae]|uniref:peptidoglycan-binding protein n=1 Tax=Actinomyces urinae TaxID=1689268 RepID=UPI00093162B1|nr:peptidoglycan-binding protein [Actinomyces urinae]
MQAKLRLLFAAIAVLTVGIVTGWAIRELTFPKTEVFQGSDFALVAAKEGELARDIRLDASLTWDKSVPVIATRSGILTRLSAGASSSFENGSEVFSIDLAPTFALHGDIPIYRDLASQDEGPDVKQFQQFLTDTSDATLEATGYFDEATRQATRGWQTQHGLEQTDVVAASSFIAIPQFPARISWAEDTRVGIRVEPGQLLGEAYYGEPSFTIEAPAAQASIITSNMRVTLQFGEDSWEATVSEIGAPKDDGSSTVILAPAAGQESICGDGCAALSSSTARIPSLIHVVERVAGIVIPTAAITNGDDGSAAVIAQDGTKLPVTVIATVGGQSIVEGVDSEQVVRVGPNAGARIEDTQ